MRCKNPLVRQYLWVNETTGELKYRIRNITDSRHILATDSLGERDQIIPCGHCIACRINKSSEWATRMMMEVKTQPENSCWFVTLTYDDDHLPPNTRGFHLSDTFIKDDALVYYDPDSRSFDEFHSSLEKKRISWFMKNLRNLVHYDSEKFGFLEPKIRFYGCGEYGDKNRRPHYHIIIFGLPLNVIENWSDGQLVTADKSKLNYPLYTSQIIERAWSYDHVPLGLHRVAPVSWETCAYTARYVQKKLSGTDAELYVKQCIRPEYSVMSRKPGIGREYFNLNKDELFNTREIIVGAYNKKRVFSLPGYYDDLFDIDPDYMIESAARKTKMKSIMKANDEFIACNTSANYLEQLEIEEMNLQAKLKTLRRDGLD